VYVEHRQLAEQANNGLTQTGPSLSPFMNSAIAYCPASVSMHSEQSASVQAQPIHDRAAAERADLEVIAHTGESGVEPVQ